MNESILVIDKSLVGEVAEVAADRVLTGKPITRVSNYFSDSTQQFHAGRWSASAASGGSPTPKTSCV